MFFQRRVYTLVAFNEENTLTADLWHKREFTDVVFSVADREFPAHKIVLAAQSEYFRALLYGNMQEGSMSSISLPEEIVPPGAFEKVLQYCYTKSLEIDEPLEVARATHILLFLRYHPMSAWALF